MLCYNWHKTQNRPAEADGNVITFAGSSWVQTTNIMTMSKFEPIIIMQTYAVTRSLKWSYKQHNAVCFIG